MSTATVTPARYRYRSDELRCDSLRTYGYRAWCRCGAPFTVRRLRDDARTDARLHVCEKSAALVREDSSPDKERAA
jgi:hypothetical protein